MRWIFKLFKLCLFTFNTFYFMLGLGLLIGAVFLYLNPNHINELIKEEYGKEYLEFMYFICAFSIFLLIVGFVGCSGILSEKSWILFIYFGMLFTIFILQFSVAIYLYIKSINYFKDFKDRILHLIKYQYGHSSVHSRAMDYLHYNFKCCGWNSPKDWYESSYTDPKSAFKTNNNVITISPSYIYKIPHSCCVNNYDLTCVLMNKFHEVGCENIVKNYYMKIEIYIAWSIAFLNLFQLILLVLSLYLLCMIFFDKKDKEKMAWRNSESNGYENFDRIENDNDQLYMTSYYL
ncbi:CD81 antigen-like [Brachionus plicatilis]|uniref:Tetraspanin n=1 Tax=Brachionus plicatilis TaxID=10195 RepID=A0A3M7R9U0_BRAPC|nr:CD81 antigen-like [Brachionus plicatilis]